MHLEHVRPFEWTGLKPASFVSRIRTGSHEGCRVALLGLPDDTGVRMNHGTPGAAEGPHWFRQALARYGTATPSGWQWPGVFDAGDIMPAADLEETHDRVTATVGALLDAGMLPVAIGGGHDLTFPFVRAVAQRYNPLGGIYLDAHLDVREETGSGMPFRRLIEDCGISRLDVIGLDPLVNSAEHTSWFMSHHGRIDDLEPEGEWPGEHLFVSIDLDVIDSSHAPGVSARNPAGMASTEADRWAFAAGQSGRVRCFDIMELCPPNDEHWRTARLAARLFLSFLRGVSQRAEAGL